MKIKVTAENGVEYGGEKFEKGEEFSPPDRVGERFIEKNSAIEVNDGGGIKAIEGGSEPSGSAEVAEEVDRDKIMDKIERDLDEENPAPDKWNPPQNDPPEPEEHPDLKGVVQEIGRSRENETLFANVRTDDEIVTLWNHKVLNNVFKVLEPGDVIGVRYEGQAEGDRTYLDYSYSVYDRKGRPKAKG